MLYHYYCLDLLARLVYNQAKDPLFFSRLVFKLVGAVMAPCRNCHIRIGLRQEHYTDLYHSLEIRGERC